jgi:hypothetical protein
MRMKMTSKSMVQNKLPAIFAERARRYRLGKVDILLHLASSVGFD